MLSICSLSSIPFILAKNENLIQLGKKKYSFGWFQRKQPVSKYMVKEWSPDYTVIIYPATESVWEEVSGYQGKINHGTMKNSSKPHLISNLSMHLVVMEDRNNQSNTKEANNTQLFYTIEINLCQLSFSWTTKFLSNYVNWF